MVTVQSEDFSLENEYLALRKKHAGQAGAVVSFVGLVRDLNESDSVQKMFLEHYPGMTEKALEQIERNAVKQFNLIDSVIIHRVGSLSPDDQIVLVIATSPHRGDAFRACEQMIDILKTKAPFWKKEKLANGERWLEQKTSDLR